MLQRLLVFITGTSSLLSLLDLLGKYIYLLLAIIGGGSTMAILAAVTEQMGHYSPLSWGAAFLIGSALTAGIFALIARMALWSLQRDLLANAYKASDKINPMETAFDKRRISIADLISPIRNSIKGKSFTACELLGPANLYFTSSTVQNCSFNQCDVIVANYDAAARNVTHMEDCHLIKCHLFRVTLIISEDMAEDYRNTPGFTGFLAG